MSSPADCILNFLLCFRFCFFSPLVHCCVGILSFWPPRSSISLIWIHSCSLDEIKYTRVGWAGLFQFSISGFHHLVCSMIFGSGKCEMFVYFSLIMEMWNDYFVNICLVFVWKTFLNGDDDSRTFVDDDKLFFLQVI